MKKLPRRRAFQAEGRECVRVLEYTGAGGFEGIESLKSQGGWSPRGGSRQAVIRVGKQGPIYK